MKTIRDKIAHGAYDPGPAPQPPARPIPVFSFGSDTPGSREYREHECLLAVHELKMEGYHSSLDLYCQQRSVLMMDFAQDLAREHGMLGHPKEKLLYQTSHDIALVHGNSLHHIVEWYERLLDLTR